MSAWWSTCAGSMNGCPARANPKRKSATAWFVSASQHAARATRSLAARHVQAGIEELQGGVADRRVDLAAVDAGGVDAGLRKFVPAVVVTFIDEDVVIDAPGNDVKLGMRDVSRGELGVVLGR